MIRNVYPLDLVEVLKSVGVRATSHLDKSPFFLVFLKIFLISFFFFFSIILLDV